MLAAVAEILFLETVEVVDHEFALGMAGVFGEPGEERLPDPRLVAVPVIVAGPDYRGDVESGLPHDTEDLVLGQDFGPFASEL